MDRVQTGALLVVVGSGAVLLAAGGGDLLTTRIHPLAGPLLTGFGGLTMLAAGTVLALAVAEYAAPGQTATETESRWED